MADPTYSGTPIMWTPRNQDLLLNQDTLFYPKAIGHLSDQDTLSTYVTKVNLVFPL